MKSFVDTYKQSGWIAVDLDGTLAEYKKWVGPLYIGDPIPKMIERVKKWIKEGKQIRIFTARVSSTLDSDDIGVEERKKVINAWIVQHIGVSLPITCEKDIYMMELWDDLPLHQVKKNTGEEI